MKRLITILLLLIILTSCGIFSKLKRKNIKDTGLIENTNKGSISTKTKKVRNAFDAEYLIKRANEQRATKAAKRENIRINKRNDHNAKIPKKETDNVIKSVDSLNCESFNVRYILRVKDDKTGEVLFEENMN